jgi:hypothetical protein
MKTPFSSAVALSLLSCTLMALAQATPPAGPGGRPHGPPPEAIAACSGKAAGATVSFTGRRGDTLTGTCEKVGDVLAARPAGGPPGGQPPAK